jgi:hypothetical protein
MTRPICAVGPDGITKPNFRLDRRLSGIKTFTILVACKCVRRRCLFLIFDGILIESLVGSMFICCSMHSVGCWKLDYVIISVDCPVLA